MKHQLHALGTIIHTKYTKFVALVILPSLLSVSALADSRPAKIDLLKFDARAAHIATHECGLELAQALRSIPICRSSGQDRCQGGLSFYGERFVEKVANTQFKERFALGLTNTYEAYHAYDGTDYRFDLNVSADAKIPTALRLRFTEYQQDDRIGKREKTEATLETEGALPVLQVRKDETTNCHYDEWGNQICKQSTFTYSNPEWILPEHFGPIVNWKNAKTGIVLKHKADFGRYIDCVEQRL